MTIDINYEMEQLVGLRDAVREWLSKNNRPISEDMVWKYVNAILDQRNNKTVEYCLNNIEEKIERRV